MADIKDAVLLLIIGYHNFHISHGCKVPMQGPFELKLQRLT